MSCARIDDYATDISLREFAVKPVAHPTGFIDYYDRPFLGPPLDAGQDVSIFSLTGVFGRSFFLAKVATPSGAWQRPLLAEYSATGTPPAYLPNDVIVSSC